MGACTAAQGEVWQGTLALVVLRTLDTRSSMRLTRSGRRELARASGDWDRTTSIMERFLRGAKARS